MLDRVRSPWALWLAAAIILILAGPHLPPYRQTFVAELLLWSFLAMSFDLLFGHLGLLSFGQATFWGVGAYGAAIGITYFRFSPAGAVILGVALAIGLAAVIGVCSCRVSGHYFVIFTVLFSLAFHQAALHFSQWTGGEDGLALDVPEQVIGPVRLSLYDPTTSYYTVVTLFVLIYGFYVLLTCHLPVGHAFTAMGSNDRRLASLKWNPNALKFLAVLLSAGFASVGGAMYALTSRFVSATLLHWTVSGDAAVWAIVGGSGTASGPIAGTVILFTLKDMLSTRFEYAYPVMEGACVIAFILWLPRGLLGRFEKRIWTRSPATLSISDEPVHKRVPPILTLESVSVRFDGLQALDGVDLCVPGPNGRDHVPTLTRVYTIGSNGAGKTTMFDAITGHVPLAAGTVCFNGEDITGLPPFMVARKGIARVFQDSSLFENLTVWENLLVAAESSLPIWHGFLPDGLVQRHSVGQVMLSVLQEVDLAGKMNVPASQLSHAEQRRLDLAIALVLRPRLILLDEPLAGLSHDEMSTMLHLLKRLSQKLQVSFLVIEHNLSAVHHGTWTVVLDHGKTIASGFPEDIVRNPRVIDAFLGDN